MGDNIFYRKWEVEKPRATLYIVHGLGEHCGRYEHVAEWFNEHNVAVYSGDYPGFGRTPGKRGHVESFVQLLDAIEHGWEQMRSEHPQVPHFMLGHSLGGLLVTEFLLSRSQNADIAGAIISSPGYRAGFEIPAWKDRLGKMLTPLFPGLAIPSGLPATAISRDPQVVEAYLADPYVHDKVSLRFYAEMNQTMKDIFERVQHFPTALPVYWIQAGADQLVDKKAAKEYYDLLPIHPMRKYKEWPGLYHELLNEPEKEEVLKDIWVFIQEVMDKAEATV